MSQYGSSPWKTARAEPLTMVDSMFLIAHHETSGKPRIAADLLGIGLVAAALAELYDVRAIYLDPLSGQVIRQDATPPPVPAAEYVLGRIGAGEPATSIASDWMLGLRDHLQSGVAAGLEERGLIRAERSALGRVRYVSQREGLIQGPQSWVYGLLRTPHLWADFQPHQQAIACICAALGIATTVTAIPADEADANFAVLVRSVGPTLNSLVKATIQARQRLAMVIRR